MIKTREYDPTRKQWVTVKKRFPFFEGSGDLWSIGLRFVSLE